MALDAHAGPGIGQAFMAARWRGRGTTFIRDPVTVLIDAIAADFTGRRMNRNVLVITIALGDRISVTVQVGIDRTGSVPTAAILIDAITADLYGSGIDPGIPIVAIDPAAESVSVSVTSTRSA
jgi:hypothetical protein